MIPYPVFSSLNNLLIYVGGGDLVLLRYFFCWNPLSFFQKPIDQKLERKEKVEWSRISKKNICEDNFISWPDEIAIVFSFVRGAKYLEAPTLFQVANVDSSDIKFVYGYEVKQIRSKC